MASLKEVENLDYLKVVLAYLPSFQCYLSYAQDLEDIIKVVAEQCFSYSAGIYKFTEKDRIQEVAQNNA